MRVIHIGVFPLDPSQAMTGPSRIVYNLAKEMVKKGGNVIVINILHFKGGLCGRKNIVEGVKVISILWFDLLKFKPDIVHVHGLMLPFHMPIIIKKLSREKYKIIYTAHGVISREKVSFWLKIFFPKAWQSMLLKNVDKITAVSEVTKSQIVTDYRISENKIIVITHGVDDLFYRVSLQKPSQINNIKTILFVGNPRWVKGLDFLIDSLSILDRNDWVLIIAGPISTYTKELISQYRSLYIKHKISFIGPVNQQQLVNEYLNAAIFCLVSRYEPFGLVALEAMATGTPTIVSDQVGMRTLIRHGKNGFIVKFGDIAELASVIERLLNDLELGKIIGMNSKASVSQETWGNKVNEYLGVYASLINNPQC